jgi:hypothetical protein
VHLLGFDATDPAVLGDEWARLKLVDLVRHAGERWRFIAFRHAQSSRPTGGSELRQLLDPNRGSRWTIGVAALLLILYAIVAGPINFYRASRRGTPQRALVLLPVYAAAMIAVIVLLAVAAKGIHGRARRLALAESGAGMATAAITRFRALYTPASQDLTVWSSEAGSVLESAAPESDNPDRVLTIDRSGLRLERLRTKPWQAALVREDGFIALGGGVSITRDPSGELIVTNRCARDLIGALISVPGHRAYFFTRIADGRSARVSEGRSFHPIPPYRPKATSVPLGADVFSALAEEAAPGLGAAWQALEDAAPGEMDWWPEDVPVLIAELDGGESKLRDSGLRVEQDRVLLRVVGYGGVL